MAPARVQPARCSEEKGQRRGGSVRHRGRTEGGEGFSFGAAGGGETAIEAEGARTLFFVGELLEAGADGHDLVGSRAWGAPAWGRGQARRRDEPGDEPRAESPREERRWEDDCWQPAAARPPDRKDPPSPPARGHGHESSVACRAITAEAQPATAPASRHHGGAGAAPAYDVRLTSAVPPCCGFCHPRRPT